MNVWVQICKTHFEHHRNAAEKNQLAPPQHCSRLPAPEQQHHMEVDQLEQNQDFGWIKTGV